MLTPHPIADLEIVGYANRLIATTCPAIVAPIFRVKAEPSRLLFPPFATHHGLVCNALEKTPDELVRLDDQGEITRFDHPFDAQHDFELWIDQEGHHHYEPIPDAARTLRSIAESNIVLARVALAAARFDVAENHCRIALCADDRLIEPLAISAAIARRRSDPGRERVLKSFAARLITTEGFVLMVDGLVASIPIVAGSEERDLFVRHPMHGIALMKAA